ncbi:nuclease-related domain-containing protein [Nonomuraea thailandensis]|uniref:nuclease-related domain-containing protein n=1 Tax=Nonomuraea thailandensis TaxID=1188745 RepID=UPI0023E3117B
MWCSGGGCLPRRRRGVRGRWVSGPRRGDCGCWPGIRCCTIGRCRVRRADVDHLVIGPGGVVLVDSKRWHRNSSIRGHGGRLWIGRRPADSLVQATVFEAARVGEVLRAAGWKVPVMPVVAVHGAKLPRWGALTVSGVTMLRADRLCGWIRRHPPQLSSEQVASISTAAERVFPPYSAVE